MERRYKNPNIRFYIIIGVLVIAIAALLIIVLYNGTEEITERGSTTFTLKTNAVIIRDEITVSASEYARIAYQVNERSSVANGDKIATVYKLGYSDELLQSLLLAREEVYAAQLEQIGSTKDSVLDDMNSSVLNMRTRINSAVMGKSGDDLLLLQTELNRLLAERMDYLRTKVQETETLRALYAKVAEKEQLVAAWSADVYAEREGVASYYFDGYEQAINTDKLNMLTPDLINRALRGSGAATWTTPDNTKVCRIVDSDHWYIAFLTDASSLTRLSMGMEYDITLKGYGEYKGIAIDYVVNGKSVINIVEINAELGELIDVRSADIEIAAYVTGIKVLEDAVQIKDGYYYIELILSESHQDMPVDVLGIDGGFAFVRPRNADDTLGEAVRYWRP